MAKWHRQYHQERAGEAQAIQLAAAEGIGHYFKSGGEEYIAWPNGETSLSSEYQQWLAIQNINAQVGING